MIKARTQTIVKSDMTPEIKRQMQLLKGSYVTIGVHDDAGSYTEGSNPPEVVEVALWQEFGTRTVPPRSFVGATVDEHMAELNNMREDSIAQIVAGKKTVEQALSEVGFKIQTWIQNKIKSGPPPPLSPATLAEHRRAGVGDAPLNVTGLLLRSVTFKVYVGGKAA